jgi:hypothetical protein
LSALIGVADGFKFNSSSIENLKVKNNTILWLSNESITVLLFNLLLKAREAQCTNRTIDKVPM